MSVYVTAAFWKATGERSVKTAAQAAVAAIGVNVVALPDVNWALVAGTAGLAGVLSILTSIGSAQIGGDGPSLGGEQLTQ